MPTRLEQLGRRYNTDKIQSSHGYLALYSMLFGRMTDNVANMTEVGLEHGGSAMMWMDFFPKAHLYGIDIDPSPALRKRLQRRIGEGRMTLLKLDSTLPSARIFSPLSMDIVLDDGAHSAETQQATLVNLWPAVRPGGFYLVEDVLVDYATLPPRNASLRKLRRHAQPSFVHLPTKYREQSLEILRRNDVFVADTLSANVASQRWHDGVTERVHDSHVVVIHRRETIEDGDLLGGSPNNAK